MRAVGASPLEALESKHVHSNACETAATMREDGLLLLIGGGNSLHVPWAQKRLHVLRVVKNFFWIMFFFAIFFFWKGGN